MVSAAAAGQLHFSSGALLPPYQSQLSTTHHERHQDGGGAGRQQRQASWRPKALQPPLLCPWSGCPRQGQGQEGLAALLPLSARRCRSSAPSPAAQPRRPPREVRATQRQPGAHLGCAQACGRPAVQLMWDGQGSCSCRPACRGKLYKPAASKAACSFCRPRVGGPPGPRLPAQVHAWHRWGGGMSLSLA